MLSRICFGGTNNQMSFYSDKRRVCLEEWGRYVECLADYREVSLIEQELMCKEALIKLNKCILEKSTKEGLAQDSGGGPVQN